MIRKPILFVGPMGAGKTTIAKELATRVSCQSTDLDDVIAKIAGMSIPDIFEQHGEAHFRDMEHSCLALMLATRAEILNNCTLDAAETSPQAQSLLAGVSDGVKALMDLVANAPFVLAGGGGVVCREDNRQLIKRHSICVYLHVPVEVQYERVKGDDDRPMLKSDDVFERLQELFALREPWFNEVAKIKLDATLPIDQVVSHAIEQLKQFGYQDL